jgi:hypothetical protein
MLPSMKATMNNSGFRRQAKGAWHEPCKLKTGL